MSSWPDHYVDQCPPQAAIAAGGRFYRLVADAKVTVDDFVSVYSMKPDRFRSSSNGKRCESMGLSLTATAEDAEKLRSAVGPLRKKKIAVGTIDQSGVMMHTASSNAASHHTWWRPNGDVAWRTFQVQP